MRGQRLWGGPWQEGEGREDGAGEGREGRKREERGSKRERENAESSAGDYGDASGDHVSGGAVLYCGEHCVEVGWEAANASWRS